MIMRPAVLIVLFLCCKTTDLDAVSTNTSLLPSTPTNTFSIEEKITTYSTMEHPALGTTSFTNNPTTLLITNPTKTASNSEMPITSSLSITMSVLPSKTINTGTNTSKNNDESPTTDKKTAVYWGIGGGLGTLALISIGILICGCCSKYKSQRRVDVSSEHTSDMPLGDCPSWRHVNVKHPLSSRITERTEHSSSY